MQTFEVATCRPIIWQLQSSDFDIFNLFDTDDIELSQLCEKMDTENNMINTADIFDIFNLFDTDDIELSQLCEKMNTENNSCKLFGLRIHDEHYELECDQFTGRSTKTYKGGLKDLELKNKKITHYCQEGKTFSVLLLHIIKKEHSHIF